MKRAHAPVQHELLTDTSDYGNKKCKHERDQIPFSSLSKPPTESPIISVRTSCVAVCAGDGRYNKFFNRDKMEVESLTDEEYNINPPVWTIFEHRGENEGIKAIAMGKDVSFVQTEGGVCWGVGSNQDGMLGVPVETTEIAMRVLPDHVIDTLTSDYYRSLFVTNTGRVFTCGRNNFRGEFGGVKDYLVQLPVELIGETVVPRMVRGKIR
jgi:alpha-tubulin suppressor-like RCC1 family protein